MFTESPTLTVSDSLPQIIFTPQTQIPSPILVVPPLRYPPKYVAGIRYDPGVFATPNALDSGYQHFKHEKENRSESEGGGKFHNSKMRGNTRRTMTELVQAKSKILGESAVYGNKQEADCSTIKEKFHSRDCPGLPLVNQNIGTLAATRKQPRNVQDKLGMDHASENNKAMEHKWQKVTRKVQDMSAKQVNYGGRDTGHRKIKGDRAGLGKE